MGRAISTIFTIIYLGCNLFEAQGQVSVDDVPEELKFIAKSDLEKWEAPEIVQKRCPYFLSGYDDEDRSIWVAEIGKWPVVELFAKGPEWEEIMYKHAYRFLKLAFVDINERATKDKPIRQINLIIDMKDFNFLRAFGSAKGVKYITDFFGLLSNTNEFTNTIWIVNASFFTERALQLLKPVLGRTFEKLDIYGTNTNTFIPQLLKTFPKDQLPPQLGGLKGFKPVKAYG